MICFEVKGQQIWLVLRELTRIRGASIGKGVSGGSQSFFSYVTEAFKRSSGIE